MAAKPREWTEEEIERAKALPVISVRAIIATFGGGDVAAKRLQALCGAPPLTAKGYRGNPRVYSAEEIETARSAYLAGGVAGVRKALGCGQDSVRRILAEAGMKMGERPRKKHVAKMQAGAMLGYVAAASGNADTLEMAAAKTLMRKGYIPVCRARVVSPSAPPDLWIVGSRRLTTNQMQELAGA